MQVRGEERGAAVDDPGAEPCAAPVMEEHRPARIDDIALGDRHEGALVGGEVGKLVLDGLWMEEVVLAEQLDEVARCRTAGSRPVARCGGAGRHLEHPHSRILDAVHPLA